MGQFDWIDFYKKFAHTLLDYKNNRAELIKNIIEVYDEIDIKLPTLEKDNNIVDIDPFTVFGLFNKNKMKYSNRTKIIGAFINKFSVDASIPNDFDSIPTLNNQNATFYYFIDDRHEDDIDNLWALFEAALNYANTPNEANKKEVSKYFDIVINTKGNGNSKVTMGLYWIAPDIYLNLDSRNIWFIYDSGVFDKETVDKLPKIEGKISSEKYFVISDFLNNYIKQPDSLFKNLNELSSEAWKLSTSVNEQIKAGNTQKGTALADEDVKSIKYWMYSPGDNASKWNYYYDAGIMGIGWGDIGDLSRYESKERMKDSMKSAYGAEYTYKNAAHATWQFANDLKPGDIVFVKKGMHQIIGRGVVTSEYIYDENVEDSYKHIRQVNWTHNGSWEHPGQAVVKTLTDITPYTEYVETLSRLFQEDISIEDEELETVYPKYTEEKFLEEVYMSREDYDTLVGLIRNKKNVILQGPPGVGKTFAAKRLAYSMIKEKNQDRVQLVQFHQSYTYEDFIEGYRPSSTGNGFEIRKGSFYNFCKKAEEDLENEYFFIIDEINRGNLSKIFGELFMLIEKDKRGNSLQLLYSDEKFNVPANVYIIGMMNTADRGLALLDYALRRRFAFFTMIPGFDSEGFIEYRNALNINKFNNLISCVKELNSFINNDVSLGEGFLIGHSYFCDLKDVNDQTLTNIVNYELIPLIKEYWFDEPTNVREWTDKLRRSIQ